MSDPYENKTGQTSYPGAANPGEPGGAVVWSNKSKSRLPKLILYIAVLIILLVILGFFFFRDEQEPQKVNINTDNITEASHNLEQSGDFQAAIDIFDEAVEATEGEEKASLLTAQAQIAFRNNLIDEAMDYAKRANDAYSNSNTLTLLGALSKKQGNTEDALMYYRQALEYMQSQEIRDRPEESAVKEIIKELENVNQ